MIKNIINALEENKIIDTFSKENQTKIIEAIKENKAVWCTNNKRTAPNSLVSEDNYWTVGIEPKEIDLCYFDFKVELPNNLISAETIEMIKKFYIKRGYEHTEGAISNCFDEFMRQYSFETFKYYFLEV